MTELNIDESAIREAAYQLWLDAGQPHGQDEAHWLQAIEALKASKPKKKTTRKAAAKPKTAKTAATKSKAAAKPKATTAKKPRAKKAAAKSE